MSIAPTFLRFQQDYEVNHSFIQIYFYIIQWQCSCFSSTSICPYGTNIYFKTLVGNTEMRDNSDQSTLQSICIMEQPLQMILAVMKEIGKELRNLSHNVKDLRRSCDQVCTSVDIINEKFSVACQMLEDHNSEEPSSATFPLHSQPDPCKANSHAPFTIAHSRNASTPAILEVEAQKEESGGSAASQHKSEPKPDLKAEMERTSPEATIDKMAAFKEMWLDQTLPYKERMAFMSKYKDEISSASAVKSLSKKMKYELCQMKVDLISMDSKQLLASFKSKIKPSIKQK